MELIKETERIWYSMYEEERDRPCLGYIRGDRWSIAVDAGHSAAHVEEFYAALRMAKLPLPYHRYGMISCKIPHNNC